MAYSGAHVAPARRRARQRAAALALGRSGAGVAAPFIPGGPGPAAGDLHSTGGASRPRPDPQHRGHEAVPDDHPTIIRDALIYARLGLPVIPLWPKKKKPRIERWPARATTDRDEIVHW